MRPTFAALTKKATKRVCMGKNPSYHIWGAPDFCLHPSTVSTALGLPPGTRALTVENLGKRMADGSKISFEEGGRTEEYGIRRAMVCMVQESDKVRIFEMF